MSRPYSIGFVGAGNMAEAIARGVLRAQMCSADQMLFCDPSATRRAVFADQLGITAAPDNAHVVSQCNAVILAVKPQVMGDVLADLAKHVDDQVLLISIAAGVSASYITAATDGRGTRVVRVMPNTPMLVGAGMSAIAGGAGATVADIDLAQRIFDAGGQTLVVDEAMIDAVTAVSGSGPAYFFYFVEAMVAGGVELGLSEADATVLARQTIVGAAQLLAESGEAPAELRRKVTSPGGTTEAAIRSMRQDDLPKLVSRAVHACAKRSKELGA